MVSYNVLSLFDGRDDGTEFREFSVSGGDWDEARYRKRLGLLAELLLDTVPGGKGPDLAVLPEVENARILEDLAGGPLVAAGYRWRAIAPAPGGAFATGLISRLPVLELRAHALAAPGSESRNLLEVLLDAGGRRLRVFALHWKSKSGGAPETEEARREAAALVARRVADILAADPGAELLLAGDFNENPDEWRRTGRRYPTALFPLAEAGALGAADLARTILIAETPAGAGLRPALAAGGALATGAAPLALYSPWVSSEGWSYHYKGVGERIDGFLLAPGLLDGEGLSLAGFSALALPAILDADGLPVPWSTRAGRGWSDHLPILLELSLAPPESRPRMKKSQKSRVESP